MQLWEVEHLCLHKKVPVYWTCIVTSYKIHILAGLPSSGAPEWYILSTHGLQTRPTANTARKCSMQIGVFGKEKYTVNFYK